MLRMKRGVAAHKEPKRSRVADWVIVVLTAGENRQERRTWVSWSEYLRTTMQMEGLEKKMTKSLPVSKRMVYNSYLKVVAKGGGAGIDKESIEQFNVNRNDNLYRLWNRMTSGSYFPPAVRTVFIPKKQGGQRPLGIPTVGDRIAQGVVKDYLEPIMEAIFHPCSYGYRPGKSAHDAIEQCQVNCIRYGWVVDVDIKGFFDNINHGMLMQLLKHHTQEKFVLLYVERWLKAGVEQEDGSIAQRIKGTPQGGVISPLLANLYLHHAFDKWISKEYSQCPFERYADDIVIHCSSREEAECLLAQLKERMAKADLTLHPEKTKIVYCKNYRRTGRHDNESFTFLGYSFEPRMRKGSVKEKSHYLVFTAAISQQAKTNIRESIRGLFNPRWTERIIESFAVELNPKIRGWANYYAKINRHKVLWVFTYVNRLIVKWISNKYKLRSFRGAMGTYKRMVDTTPKMFYHWQLGVTKIG
jgi:group II intron reverse transcriptase/maturase